jgi:hypothetical protein
VIRSPSYLVWSRTFLLEFGLTDLSHFGRHLRQNKAIANVFNGSVVYFNVGIGLICLGKSCGTRQILYFQLFINIIWPLNTAGVLSPEVNLRSSHNTKPTSICRSAIAREAAPRAGELKPGRKTQKLPVVYAHCPKALKMASPAISTYTFLIR